MTDLIERLRDADPVDSRSLEVPRALESRVLDRPQRRPAPPRRAALALVIAAVFGVALVALAGDRPGTQSLAARAYAATTGPGVTHWRTEILMYSNGRFFDHQRVEGYTRGSTMRYTLSTVRRGTTRLIVETRISGRRSRTYLGSEDDYISGPAPPRSSTNPMQIGDPVATFRRAFRERKLRPAGPNRYAVELPGPRPRIRLVYEFDPKTALPTRLTIPSSTVTPTGRRYENRTEMRFVVYERLPATAANVAKLEMAAHPGAGPKDVDPADHFRVLRGGAPPNPAAARRLAALASNLPRRFGLRPAQARRLTGAFYLLPGHGYLCLVTRSGGGCATVDQALRRGVVVGSPRGLRTIAAPDGVVALRVRLRGGKTSTVAVRDNAARLPAAGYAWSFIRDR